MVERNGKERMRMKLMPLLIPSGKLAIRDVIPSLVLDFSDQSIQLPLPFHTFILYEKSEGKPIADTDFDPYKWEKKNKQNNKMRG